MNAIKVEQYGDASVLKLVDTAPTPVPGEGQALVKIHMAGVNFVDIYQRKGIYTPGLPYIPGLEASGMVEDVGAGVTGLHCGDRVAYTGHMGSYAEYAAISADKLIPLPSELTFEEGAAFPLQGMTAHFLLNEYRKVAKGDTVLIHAAAGGVGQLLVQWAKHLGATVIGTVSTEEKVDIAYEAGADHVILYTKQDFVAETKKITKEKGVQLILDGVGKSTLPGDLEVAAKFGHIVVFGSASGVPDPVSTTSLMAKSLSLSSGSLFDHAATHEQIERRSRDVLQAIRKKWLKLRIDHVIPLAEAERAHRLLENRETVGKVILQVTG
ncbi:MAG: NADPH:quinone reductase [Verrucomicrobia bacterium]|nr:NADPH:quinone reductase [Verrucomicrobiota bacterium]